MRVKEIGLLAETMPPHTENVSELVTVAMADKFSFTLQYLGLNIHYLEVYFLPSINEFNASCIGLSVERNYC